MQRTNFGTHKIDKSSLETYGMVIATLQVLDKLGCSWFFQEIFLMANINIEVVLDMFFLTFHWRTYTTKKILPSTHRIKLINEKKFSKAALDENIKNFVMHVSSLGSKITIYLAREAQMALLLAKKVTVPA